MACFSIRHVMHLAYFLLMLSCSCCEQLYVQPDNTSYCPPGSTPENCAPLTAYAMDPYAYFAPNSSTTLTFPSGKHTLSIPFRVSEISDFSLTFQGNTSDQSVIICERNAVLSFSGVRKLELVDLTIHSCGYNPGILIYQAQPGILVQSVNHTVVKDCVIYGSSTDAVQLVYASLVSIRSHFLKNEHGLVTYQSFITLEDSTFTQNNGFYFVSSILTLNGVNMTHNNDSVHVFYSTVHLSGNTLFENNTSIYGSGAAIDADNSELNFYGDTTFSGNKAFVNGGAISGMSTRINFVKSGTTNFMKNIAMRGGGIFLTGYSRFLFGSDYDGTVLLRNNIAQVSGGGMYIENPETSCEITFNECSFQVNASTYSLPIVYFENNSAADGAGDDLYGGNIDDCNHAYTSDYFTNNNASVFDAITNFTGELQNKIASNPTTLCFIIDNATNYNCSELHISRKVYPGGTLQIKVVALGQLDVSVPASVLLDMQQLTVDESQRTQTISSQEGWLSYSFQGKPGNGTMVLYIERPCVASGTNLTVEVELQDCPPGFEWSGMTQTCLCNDKLASDTYAGTCFLSNGTIPRDGTFWVGYNNNADNSDNECTGVIFYLNCPFDYCITDYSTFRVDDRRAQCAFNRYGTLCGGCVTGYSLRLGTSECHRCTNNHLALLLPFAIAGILLVTLLLVLNLTVATGMINGLVLYANILSYNHATFFPSMSGRYIGFLKVFIAWINLDFGIESCFYDGLDAYAKTWIEFAFPLYIWSLIGLVFVCSHFSRKASKLLGTNPVATLATLIFLSYAKVLRIVVEAFSFARLECSNEHTRIVWLQDGNVCYLQGKHIPLFVASLLVTLVLLIPYTLLLLSSQWLRVKSHWKILSWINRPQLSSFLDAYHAPYKPMHRYWTGLLLIVRFALLLTSIAVHSNGNLLVSNVAILIFVLAVQSWAWVAGGIYKNWYNNALETFFLFNLGALTAATFLIKYELASMALDENEAMDLQAVIIYIFISIAFVVFIGIVLRLAYLRVCIVLGKKFSLRKALHIDFGTVQSKRPSETSQSDTKVDVSISLVSLREPLLEEN